MRDLSTALPMAVMMAIAGAGIAVAAIDDQPAATPRPAVSQLAVSDPASEPSTSEVAATEENPSSAPLALSSATDGEELEDADSRESDELSDDQSETESDLEDPEGADD